MHHTKDKEDIAAAKAIADLAVKGYSVFTPVVCEHLPFDLMAYENGKSYRIQAKYNSDGEIKNKTSWADKNGNHYRKYKPDDFDFYALFLNRKSTTAVSIALILENQGIIVQSFLPNYHTSWQLQQWERL
jgi:PD-(D/E)XK endonuclease